MKLNEWLKGKFSYDQDGQYIWLVKANEHIDKIADLRGWGAIQQLFKRKDQSIDIQAAGLFQDELGKWVVDALNEKLESETKSKPEEKPVLVGHLNRDYGYNHYLPAKAGTEVYELKDRYFFTITPADNLVEVTQQLFYKETLKDHKTFIK